MSLYTTQKEKLLQSFKDEIELQIENGVNNTEGCKAMIQLLNQAWTNCAPDADQVRSGTQNLRDMSNFLGAPNF